MINLSSLLYAINDTFMRRVGFNRGILKNCSMECLENQLKSEWKKSFTVSLSHTTNIKIIPRTDSVTIFTLLNHARNDN